MNSYNKNVFLGSLLYALVFNVFGVLYVALTKRFPKDKLAYFYKVKGLVIGEIISCFVWILIGVAVYLAI